MTTSPTTRLDAWLREQGLIKHLFAKRIGITPKQLRNALKGNPSRRVAERIIEASNGALDWNALYGGQETKPAQGKNDGKRNRE